MSAYTYSRHAEISALSAALGSIDGTFSVSPAGMPTVETTLVQPKMHPLRYPTEQI